MKTRAFLLLHLAVLLAGGTGILGRLISLGGLGLVWYRMLVAVVTMLLTLLCLRRKFAVSRRNGLRIAACGMLLTLHWVAFFASIKASNVLAGVACIATSCFFTSLFDPLLNRHKVSWRDVLISFIAIAGILLVFSLDVRYRMGITLGILSAALYSLFSVCNVRTAQATGTDSSTMLIWELIGGAALLTLIVPLYVLLSHTPLPVPAPATCFTSCYSVHCSPWSPSSFRYMSYGPYQPSRSTSPTTSNPFAASSSPPSSSTKLAK